MVEEAFTNKVAEIVAESIDGGEITPDQMSRIKEDAKTDLCENYCKWPDIWDEEKEGCELIEGKCTDCPLGWL